MIAAKMNSGDDDFGEDKSERVSSTKRKKTISGSQCSTTIMGKMEKLQRPRNYTTSSTIQRYELSCAVLDGAITENPITESGTATTTTTSCFITTSLLFHHHHKPLFPRLLPPSLLILHLSFFSWNSIQQLNLYAILT
ncbi:hypothetical protein Bca4012_084236 [Brassica carinata]